MMFIFRQTEVHVCQRTFKNLSVHCSRALTGFRLVMAFFSKLYLMHADDCHIFNEKTKILKLKYTKIPENGPFSPKWDI